MSTRTSLWSAIEAAVFMVHLYVKVYHCVLDTGMSGPPRPRQEIQRRHGVRWRAGSVAHAPLLWSARSANHLPQQTEEHVQVKGLAERPVAEVLPRGSL